MFLVMTQPTSRIPIRLTIAASVLLTELIFIVRVFALADDSQPPNVMATTQTYFSWFVAASGFIMMALAIGYGFVKKTRYENVVNDRDEWKSLAESREEKIKDLKVELGDQKIKFELKITTAELESKGKDTTIQNLGVSNHALVSLTLQMKAILKQLRLAGKWEGDEEALHKTQ